MTQDFVEFRNVEKSYDGETLVVDNLNLSIAKGEFLTMLGPSGSGKTTCLMMLAGFEGPSQGEIRLSGKPIQNVPPYRRNIGMVFQNYALFPHLSVGENLSYPLRARRMNRADTKARVERALDMVQMRAFESRRPSQLSGGQQQRVALARALVFEPDLVLMDEPLGALDRNLREHLQYEIKRLHQTLGVTIVYVTHDQSEALTMSDRIAIFNAGKVEQIGGPAEIYEQPQTAFVAGFIGESNRLSGVALGSAGGRCDVSLGDGYAVTGRAHAAHAPGSSVVAALRPERVKIGARAADEANRFTGRVRELVYLGDHLRIILDMPAGQSLIAKIPNGEDGDGVTPGATCAVGWAPADCIVLPTP